jgi:hypothetical protein
MPPRFCFRPIEDRRDSVRVSLLRNPERNGLIPNPGKEHLWGYRGTELDRGLSGVLPSLLCLTLFLCTLILFQDLVSRRGSRGSRGLLVPLPQILRVGLVVVSGGMAPLSTRHEPAWTFGNGRGMEARQGAIRIFWGRDADRLMISGAQGSESSAPPAARSVEPSAHTAIEVRSTRPGRWSPILDILPPADKRLSS